ncbi:MAG TPA: hypothetical protein DC047_03670 [Blastocatellia bacterium]|nr:hypothetical protein [Blastocatellia bacterium]
MGFPPKIAEQALINSGRHCSICHKFCGSKMELHHIEQRADGGEDSYDNCLPVCFDCHADVKSYNERHPKGRKYSVGELKAHRDNWYRKVASSTGPVVDSTYVELDRKTFKEIIEKLQGSIRDYVCEHDYANSFYQDWHSGLNDFLNSAKLPENEFFDAEMEGIRATLREDIRKFRVSLAQNTFMVKVDGGGRLFRMNDDPYNNPVLLGHLNQQSKDQAQFEALIKEHQERNNEVREELNELAQRACDSFAEFIRFGKRRLVV